MESKTWFVVWRLVLASGWIQFIMAMDMHGGVPMGVSTDGCDNGRWKLATDWVDDNDYEYTCQLDQMEAIIHEHKAPPFEHCIPERNLPLPLHKCMTEKINYEEQPPTAGPHRPLWPVYGEYLYLPPQRWIHSLEHGAAVFLHHPCADKKMVKWIRGVARRCLRKHIITPYRQLPEGRPLAVLTYGCKLLLSGPDDFTVQEFIKSHALTAPERGVVADGQYYYGLLKKASVVSDIHDSYLCPKIPKKIEDLIG